MKCKKCQFDNKEGAKVCRKCSYDLTLPPLWRPGWKWHARTLTIIYALLIMLFFTLNHVLKPYLRQIPSDVTPWLKELPAKAKVG